MNIFFKHNFKAFVGFFFILIAFTHTTSAQWLSQVGNANWGNPPQCPGYTGVIGINVWGNSNAGPPFYPVTVVATGTDGSTGSTTINSGTTGNINVTPNGTGAVSYTIVGTSANYGSKTIKVLTLPARENFTSAGSISAPSPTSGSCSFDPGTIGNSSSPSGGWGNPATYKWEKSTNGGSSWSTVSGAGSSSYNPPAITTTTHYRRLTKRNCTAYSYLTSNTIVLTVTPNITSAGSISGTNETGCAGYNPSAISGTNLGSGVEYRWESSSNGGSSWFYAGGSQNVDPISLSTTRVYRRRARRAGCSTWLTSSGTVTKTVISGPSVSASASPSTVCNGASVTLSASGASSYTWSNGLGSGSSKTINPSSSGTYYVTGTTSGCSATASVSVTVNACCSNITSAGSISGTESGCGSYNPGNISNSSTPSGGSGTLQYQWQVSTNGSSWSNISGATSSTYNPGTISSTRYYKRGARRSGCTPYSYSNTVTKTVKSVPSVSASASPSTVCSGAAVSLSASGASSYTWSNGLGSGSSKTVNPTSSGYYYVTGTTSGCSATASTYVTVNSCCVNVTSAGSISGNQSLCGSYNPSNITNSSTPTGGSGSLQYQWQVSTNNTTWSNISGATSATYDPGTITATRYYKRGARRSGCSPYVYSNVVDKIVTSSVTNPGTISGDQSNCGSFDPGNITSTAGPSGGSGTIQYQWEVSTNNSTWTPISGATSTTYNPPTITATRYYKRGARRAGCSGYMYTASVTKEVVVNYSNGGAIAGDQANCGSFNPSNITNTGAPTGGSGGSTQYQWEVSTNNSTWTPISGATSATYNPPTITATRYYKRGARRAPCTPYAYSNVVTKTVSANVSNGGTIAGDETSCGSYNPGNITSSVAATGGTGTLEYQWEVSTNNSTWTPISGATSASYNPPTITATRYYRRGALRDGCSPYVYTNTVTKTVVPGMTSNGTIAGNETNCGAYNPTNITSSASANGPGTLEYQWYVSTDNTNFTPISGATTLTYNPGTITATRYYKRGVRSVGCPNYTYSNTVTKTVILNYTNGGAILGDQSNCGSYNPTTINSSTTPSGGAFGTLQYQWEVSTDNVNWTSISGATSATYDPATITATRYYKRGARRSTCTDLVYSNVATKTVSSNITNAGTVEADEIICVSPYDPAVITQVTAASGGNGGAIEYQWFLQTGASPWITLPGATAATYDPAPLNPSTIDAAGNNYFRGARRAGCTSFLYTNWVNKNIDDNFTDGGTIAANESECGNYDPALITNVTAPSGASGAPEYQWKSSTDSVTWTDIPGATNADYDPPMLTLDSLFYMRGAKTANCSSLVFSNGVSKRKSANCHEDCTNGVDDNGDGQIDCDDVYCRPEIESVLAVDGTCPCGVVMGSISITAAGAQVTYYSIDGGQSFYVNGTFNDLEPGSYNVMIKNGLSNCTPTAYVNNPVVLTDPNCPEICNNGIDDDCDGKVDCDDDTCKPNTPNAIIFD